MNQPVKIAIQGSGKLKKVSQSSGRLFSMRPLRLKYEPEPRDRQHDETAADHDAKREEWDEHGRAILPREIGQADFLGIKLMLAIKLPRTGMLIA